MKKMKKWLTHEFSSGSYAGDDFTAFAKDFKATIKEQIKETGAKIHAWNNGHYYVSGFLEKEGKFVYFSISDVRYFKNEWNDNILIRTAKSDKDYTGGPNNSTKLENFGEDMANLFHRM